MHLCNECTKKHACFSPCWPVQPGVQGPPVACWLVIYDRTAGCTVPYWLSQWLWYIEGCIKKSCQSLLKCQGEIQCELAAAAQLVVLRQQLYNICDSDSIAPSIQQLNRASLADCAPCGTAIAVFVAAAVATCLQNSGFPHVGLQ